MNNRDIATWIMVAAIIGIGIYLIFYVHSESHQCLNNPYTYSIKLLEKANDANVSCMCSANKPYGKGGTVLLTRDGFQEIKTFP